MRLSLILILLLSTWTAAAQDVQLPLDKILPFDDALAAQLEPFEVGKTTPFTVRMNTKTKNEWWQGRRANPKTSPTAVPGQHIFVFVIDDALGDRVLVLTPVIAVVVTPDDGGGGVK